MNRLPLIAILTFIYCAWNALSLISAWQTSSYEKHAWIVFAIWILPTILYWLFSQKKKVGHPAIILCAIFSSFLGSIASLNALEYVGLAFACFGFLPWSFPLLLWFIGSFSWMPAFGWLESHSIYQHLFLLRMAIAALSAMWAAYILFKDEA